jgi:hypothetical protein
MGEERASRKADLNKPKTETPALLEDRWASKKMENLAEKAGAEAAAMAAASAEEEEEQDKV